MTSVEVPTYNNTSYNNTNIINNNIVRKRKSETWKKFFDAYPPNKKGGTDTYAWKKAKSLKLTDDDFDLMFDDIENRKALMSDWYTQYATGICRYLEEKIWLTPVTPEQKAKRKSENLSLVDRVKVANGLMPDPDNDGDVYDMG